jgi:putative acetyltransferase
VQLPVPATVRPVTDDDRDALVSLIGEVYGEYAGCVLDLPGVDADLLAMRTYIDGLDGDLWVVEDDDGVLACGGWAPSEVDDEPALEIKRIYVAERARRQGLGRWLITQVEQVARERGRELVHLWSDTRFEDAHRLYGALGYVQRPETRDLHDPSGTTELHFVKRL